MLRKIGGERKVEFTEHFKKQFYKLPIKIQKQAEIRITLFAKNKYNPVSLRDHALKGSYKNYRSINITGDVRALYYLRDDGTVLVLPLLVHIRNFMGKI